MKLLLDMNLSPAWIPVLEAQGWKATHWYSVGPVDAPDALIMRWAKEHGYCVVTNDLDFSAILAATRAEGPSVIQIRGQDLSPETLGPILVDVLRDHESALSLGAILTVDVRNARVRRLPLR
jgi:predicted nuclease of predicted toxin-antitoxin system